VRSLNITLGCGEEALVTRHAYEHVVILRKNCMCIAESNSIVCSTTFVFVSSDVKESEDGQSKIFGDRVSKSSKCCEPCLITLILYLSNSLLCYLLL
jgi:hypothetical protein